MERRIQTRLGRFSGFRPERERKEEEWEGKPRQRMQGYPVT